jgi:hypothetical protein
MLVAFLAVPGALERYFRAIRAQRHIPALRHIEHERQGLARIELAVRADNAQAIRLHKNVGFRQEGILKGGVRVDGSYKDVIVMVIVDPAVALAGGGSGLSGA